MILPDTMLPTTNEMRVIRHGESENNVLDIECADLSNKGLYGLTDAGREQMANAARLHTDLSVILCSPLRRAKESAAFFARSCGVESVPENLLVEQSVGIFENRPNSEKRAWKEKTGHTSSKLPGGESHEEVEERARRLLAEISERYSNQRILLVTHGGFTLCLLRVVFDRFGMDDWEDYNEHLGESI